MRVKAILISNSETLKDKAFVRSCNFTLQEHEPKEAKTTFKFFEYPCFDGVSGVYFFTAESEQLNRKELIQRIQAQVIDDWFEGITVDCNILADDEAI